MKNKKPLVIVGDRHLEFDIKALDLSDKELEKEIAEGFNTYRKNKPKNTNTYSK